MTDSGSPEFEDLLARPVREAVQGSPYGAWRSIASADAAPLAFGFPFPDAFPTDELGEAAEAVLAEDGAAALQYGGGEDVEHLAEFVVDRAGDRGIDTDEEGVAVTNGATHAIDGICGAVVEPGDPVAVGAPTFMGALTVFRTHGADLLGIPVDDDGMDVAALADELRARREEGRPIPKLVYVVPNFQNPTGVTMPRERRERLVELAIDFDLLVLADDAYGDLRYDGDPVEPLAAIDEEGRVLRVETVSKTIAPGVRTGWVIGHPDLVAAVGRTTPGGSHSFARSVLGRYCAAGHFEATVADLRDAYARRRDLALELLDEHLPPGSEYSDPDGGFFVWVELPEGADAGAILDRAVEEGVAYLPGTMFYPNGGGERSLRLSFSFASPEELERGIAALGRVTRSALADR